MHIDGENESDDGLMELPTYDDGPHDDVDIEITEDDLGENLADFDIDEEDGEPEEGEPEADVEEEEEPVAEEEQEEEPEEKPKRRDAQKRIAELARRAQEAERRAQEIEARLQQEAALRQQSDLAMMTHYERNLKTQAQSIKVQLQEAISMGETEKQIDLQTQLMQVQQDLTGVESWKREQEAVAAQPQRQQPAQQQQQREAAPTLQPTTAEWIQRNTWFQPQSPDFDPEMHEEATLYARRIERRYKSEGREDEIGSVAYFTEIERHLQSEFPDAFEPAPAPKKAAPPMSRNTPVTPVSRAAPEGQTPKNSKTIRLTADQRRMAHQLAESGAIKKNTGGRMTPAEAERYYAVHLMKQARR